MGHRESCCDLCHGMCFLCFSLRSLWFLALLFKSLIHSEFIFVYSVRRCSSFILLHVAVQCSQHHWRDFLFSIVYSCLLCQRVIDHKCMGLFPGIPSCFMLYVPVFIPGPYCFDDCSFVGESEIRKPNSFSEKYKTLMKEIEEDTNKWKNIPCLWIRGIKIVKMSILPKMIESHWTPIKISMAFLIEIKKKTSKIKHTHTHNKPHIGKAILIKKEENWGYNTSLF